LAKAARILLTAFLAAALALPLELVPSGAEAAADDKPPSARAKIPMRKGDKEKDAKVRGGFPPAKPVISYSPAADASLKAVRDRRARMKKLEAQAKGEGPEAEAAAKTLRFFRERVEAALAPARKEVADGQYDKAHEGLRRMARGNIPPPPGADKSPPKEGEKPAGPKADPDAAAKAQAEDLARTAIQNEAAVMLGDLHMEGKGAPKNFSLARGRFLAAAKRGDVDAAYRLALLSERGIAVPFSPTQAIEWYEVAAHGDHIPASLRLAQAYRDGDLELPTNPDMAKAWYREAAKLGSEEARRALTVLETENPTPRPGIADAAASAGRDLMRQGGGLAPSSLSGPEDLGQALGQAMGDIMGRMAAAMVESITGTMGGEALRAGAPEEPDPAFRSLLDRYVAAVNAKDLAALKGLFDHASMACVSPGGEADHDRLLTGKFARPLDATRPPGIRLTRLAPEGSLPYEGLMDYPQRPSHYAAVALAGTDGGDVTLSTALIKGDAGWTFVFPCLKPEARAMMAAEAAPVADDPDRITVPPRDAGKPLRLVPDQGRLDTLERTGEVTLQGAGAAFLERFVGYLKAKDTLGLDGLIHPTARACITRKTAPFFAFINRTLMDIDFARAPEVRTHGLRPGFEGTAYRPAPTHEVEIKYGVESFADGKGRSWRSVSLYLVNDGDRWNTVPPCPTAEQMAMLPMLEALYEGMAKGTVRP
jgi:TPR repeat protein